MGYFYILASSKNGTLYCGVTRSLSKRVYDHKMGQSGSKFTSMYKVHQLVYAEQFDRITDAILREKQVKKWNRAWKIDLIEKLNPTWKDLSDLYCPD